MTNTTGHNPHQHNRVTPYRNRALTKPRGLYQLKATLFYIISIFLAVLLCLSEAYHPSATPSTRREAFQKASGFAAAAAAVVFGPVPKANAVISSKYCAYGTGDGCEDLAEGNELIKELQARSAANKEAIQQVGILW